MRTLERRAGQITIALARRSIHDQVCSHAASDMRPPLVVGASMRSATRRWVRDLLPGVGWVQIDQLLVGARCAFNQSELSGSRVGGAEQLIMQECAATR